ncbi:MAG: photosystem II reaction center protein T [Coleofasciculaceae cyanobacterium RL_1_1]|nr:photosystem II reaction center protein T [Coleofasciculaceae cyanobacterium RL_1_1]
MESLVYIFVLAAGIGVLFFAIASAKRRRLVNKPKSDVISVVRGWI